MTEQKATNILTPQAWLMWLISQRNHENGLQRKSIAESTKFKYKHVRRVKGTYNPEIVMNKIHQRKGDAEAALDPKHSFFNLETHKLSMLVPEIMFYKVDGEKFTPFYFPVVSDYDPLDPASASTTMEYAGAYAGGNSVIKNFKVSLKGSDPFTAKKFLEADLTIKVDSLSNIFLNKNGYARLADLFTISLPKSRLHGNVGSKVKAGQIARPIEIMATIGYALKDPEGIFTSQEIDEVRKNSMILRMNVNDHTISVQRDGTASINIKYTARISEMEENRAAFDVTGDAASVAIEASLKALEQNVSDDITKTQEDEKKRKNLEAQLKRKRMLTKIESIRSITTDLDVKGRFFFEKVKMNRNRGTDLYKYLQISEEGSDDGTAGPVAKAPKSPPTKKDSVDKNKKASEKALADLESRDKTFHYILFGDMIESFCLHRKRVLNGTKKVIKELRQRNAISSSEETTRLEYVQKAISKINKFKVLLPDIEIVFHNNRKKRLNLADMPISVDIYQKHIFNNIVNTRAQTYSLSDFLSDCSNKLLPAAIGGFSNKAPNIVNNKDQVFAHTTFTGPQVAAALGSSRVDVDQIQGPNYVSLLSPNDDEEYFIIYPEPDAEVGSTLTGNEEKDFKKNIYHLHLGKNRGIIKNITFNKFTVPFRQESLMTNQIGLYDELKMPYSANVTLFGNTLFYPGSQIYIDPYSIGFGDPRDENSAAVDLGLGGYYVVLSVDSDYSESGRFETRLTCSFASWPKPKANSENNGEESDKPDADAANQAESSPDADEGDGAPARGDDDPGDPNIGTSVVPRDIEADTPEAEYQAPFAGQATAADPPPGSTFQLPEGDRNTSTTGINTGRLLPGDGTSTNTAGSPAPQQGSTGGGYPR